MKSRGLQLESPERGQDSLRQLAVHRHAFERHRFEGQNGDMRSQLVVGAGSFHSADNPSRQGVVIKDVTCPFAGRSYSRYILAMPPKPVLV